jgi:hypothetical protein
MMTTSRMSWALAFVWLAVIGTGTAMLTAYKGRPGAPAHAPAMWPADAMPRASDRHTLVMLAHPRCPCTRASMTELAELMQRVGDRVSARVLFVHPAGTARDWHETDTWRSARAIPNVEVVDDRDGLEAKRFGAETSGETLVYDASGKLVFTGGLTPARGHESESVGRDRIAALVLGSGGKAPVFGCALHDPEVAR